MLYLLSVQIKQDITPVLQKKTKNLTGGIASHDTVKTLIDRKSSKYKYIADNFIYICSSMSCTYYLIRSHFNILISEFN